MPKISIFAMGLTLVVSLGSMGQDNRSIQLYGAARSAMYELHAGSADGVEKSSELCFTFREELQPHCFEAREGNQVYFESPNVDFYAFPNGSSTKIGIFTAERSFGGSGTATLLTALAYDQQRASIIDLLPPIVLSRQAEDRVWLDPSISQFPIISKGEITAKPDSTVEGAHKYEIQSFTFDLHINRYQLVDRYITKRAYNIFGTPTPFSVLAKEDKTIQGHLRRRVRAD